MENNVNNDANDSLVKPKLTMKFLYDHIKKLEEENLMLTNRLCEYERKIDMLIAVHHEVASTMEVQLVVEKEKSTETQLVLADLGSTMHMLVPRASRHPVHKESPLWLLLVKSVFRFLFRGRYGYAFVKRRNKLI